MDGLYQQDSGASVLSEVADRLATGVPPDRGRVDIASYRGLRSPWNDWNHVVQRGRHWAEVLAQRALADGEVET